MALGRVRESSTGSRILLIMVSMAVMVLTLDNLRLFGTPILDSVIRLETHYYYALLGLLLPMAFLLYRFSATIDLLAIDIILALGAMSCCFWLFAHAGEILDDGWEFVAPQRAIAVSLVLWLLVLEAVRRVSGMALFLFVLVFSAYPLVADQMPEAISGMATGLSETAAYHTMSIESLLGLPFRAFANLVIGFLVFGVALQHTGGGRFFIDLAFALLGRVRGGPAKVAIVASGLMGSMSGSVITNVLTTGQLTIPAMKKSGIEPHTAAGIEACASTGGVLLPPIMGSTAFVMATFLDMPYYQVALAAAVPALLYFAALFIQLDAYAARRGLTGSAETELPSVADTLRQGWYYIAAFILLVVLLLVMQREALAPWAATLCLLLVNQLSSAHRFDTAALLDFIRATGSLLVELLVILSGVGLIVGALSVTGLSGTLINELLFIAGGSVGILLLMGAVTSFILGIGMTVTAAYIFLAIVLAPALIEGGLHPVAVHLFILYWGMLSFITPPVALGAFAAASIAGASPIRTGFTAMKLGAITYMIPFFFVLNPALILAQSAGDAVVSTIEVLLGIFFVAGAIQRYVPGIGSLHSHIVVALLISGGTMIALPDLGVLNISVANWQLNTGGLVLIILGGLMNRYTAKQQPQPKTL
jgi:TRAP transporter 4TM/12TM fusion protein